MFPFASASRHVCKHPRRYAQKKQIDALLSFPKPIVDTGLVYILNHVKTPFNCCFFVQKSQPTDKSFVLTVGTVRSHCVVFRWLDSGFVSMVDTRYIITTYQGRD